MSHKIVDQKLSRTIDVQRIDERDDFSDADLSQTLTRDWLDQLTTHAYTAAPDIVLCGNKVLKSPATTRN